MLYLLMALIEACGKKQPVTGRLKSERAEKNSKTFLSELFCTNIFHIVASIFVAPYRGRR